MPNTQNLYHPVSVPVWDDQTSETQISQTADNESDAASVPAGATAFMVSALTVSDTESWVTYKDTDDSGFRIGGPSSLPTFFRLGTGAAPRVISTQGSATIVTGFVWFYGNPPPASQAGGGTVPLDVPVWDGRTTGEEFGSLAADDEAQLTPPYGAAWVQVSVLETGANNVAFLGITDAADKGVAFGGNSDPVVRFRIANRLISRGKVTTAHAGTVLHDANASFVTDGVAVHDVVTNMTDGSRGRVTAVTSEIQLAVASIAGGTQNDFDAGENYVVARPPNLYVHNPESSSSNIGVMYFYE